MTDATTTSELGAMRQMTTVSRFSIDIETEPNADVTPEFDESSVAIGNLKDPEKIAAKIEEARAKAISRAALSPFFGRLLAVGIAYRAAGNVWSHVNVRNREGDADEAERELLVWLRDEIRAFFRRCSNAAEIPGYCTFNGCGFDVPYLTIRSAVLRSVPPQIDVNPYICNSPRAMHLDVMQCLKRWLPDGQSIGLKGAAKHLLNKECNYLEDGIDKSNMGAVPTDQIVKLCTWDVETTLELAELCSKTFHD